MLEKMGAGSVLISVRKKRALDRSAAVLLAVFGTLCAICFAFMVFIMIMIATGVFKMPHWILIPIIVGSFGTFSVVVPLAAAWWHSLKVASALAGDAVDEVIQSIERLDVMGEQWDVEVVAKARILARKTLPQLSAGWGVALARAAAALMLFALGLFFSALNWQAWKSALNCVVCVAVAFGFALDVAVLSHHSCPRQSLRCSTLDLLRLKTARTAGGVEQVRQPDGRAQREAHRRSERSRGQQAPGPTALYA
jgi:hypothetical protein